MHVSCILRFLEFVLKQVQFCTVGCDIIYIPVVNKNKRKAFRRTCIGCSHCRAPLSNIGRTISVTYVSYIRTSRIHNGTKVYKCSMPVTLAIRGGIFGETRNICMCHIREQDLEVLPLAPSFDFMPKCKVHSKNWCVEP